MPKIPGFTHNAGKGSTSELLPHRSALNTLAGGDPSKRTMNQYAKATPSGPGKSILGMSTPGTDGVNG